MRIARRQLLVMGCGLAAALALAPAISRAGDEVEIAMRGDRNGTRVAFDPIGVRIRPGQTVRWTNRDPANVHTATAYHPAAAGRPLRIPPDAEPWDSDYLLPGESFAVTLTEPGIYDYYCQPHEQAGMVGRIVVASPGARPEAMAEGGREGLPAAALRALPPVPEILQKGTVRRP